VGGHEVTGGVFLKGTLEVSLSLSVFTSWAELPQMMNRIAPGPTTACHHVLARSSKAKPPCETPEIMSSK
jgi:hypothetical protein